ncbi:Protein tyrosine and serine/threonine kinase [Pelomyxa schiedti]|nr:Protein tyrosine and serine/threonine kinase [Pelomyxa schiedti]
MFGGGKTLVGDGERHGKHPIALMGARQGCIKGSSLPEGDAKRHSIIQSIRADQCAYASIMVTDLMSPEEVTDAFVGNKCLEGLRIFQTKTNKIDPIITSICTQLRAHISLTYLSLLVHEPLECLDSLADLLTSNTPISFFQIETKFLSRRSESRQNPPALSSLDPRNSNIFNVKQIDALTPKLFTAMCSNPKLKFFQLSGLTMKPEHFISENIATLNLSGNRVKEHASFLLDFKSNKSLTKLDLSNNKIAESGCLLLETLQSHPLLRKLVLSDNNMSDSDNECWRFLGQSHISELILQKNLFECKSSSLVSGLSENHFLTMLDLSNNRITTTEPLAECLSRNRALTWLNLASNVIGDSAVPLFRVLSQNRTLTYLNLGGLIIASQEGTTLTRYLSHNHTLLYLDLSSCSMKLGGDDLKLSVAWWGDFVRWNNSLTSLDLNSLRFDFMPVIKGMMRNRAIHFLSMRELDCENFDSWIPLINSTSSLYTLQTSSRADIPVKSPLTGLAPSPSLWKLQLGKFEELPSIKDRETDIRTKSEARFHLSFTHNEAKMARKKPYQRSAEESCPGGDILGRHPQWCQRAFASALWNGVHSGAAETRNLILVSLLHRAHFQSGVIINNSDESLDMIFQAAASSERIAQSGEMQMVQSTTVTTAAPHWMVKLLIEERATAISYITAAQARFLVHKFLSLKSIKSRSDILCLVREWVRVENWDAVNEVCLARAVKGKDLDLSYLGLSLVRPVLVSLECSSIDLSNNHIDGVPTSLYKIEHVNLKDNPLSEIPIRFRELEWGDMRRFLRYSEDSLVWENRKLLLVGDGAAGKTTLARCLKKKSSTSISKNVATDGISINKFKIGSSKWIVWDLGGQEVLYPSHQFFLCSSAIFLIVFDLSAVLPPNPPSPKPTVLASLTSSVGLTPVCKKIAYWVNQIQASSPKDHSSSQLVLVGTHLDKITSLESAVQLFSSVHRQQKCAFSGLFCVSCSNGNVVQLCQEQGTFRATVHQNNGFSHFASELVGISSSSEVVVPRKWSKLSKVLSRHNEEVITWNRFCEIASSIGIGVSRDQEENFAEHRMCADFLADSGILIHFLSAKDTDLCGPAQTIDEFELLASSVSKNTGSSLSSIIHVKKSKKLILGNASLFELVVLKPQWLSEVMKSVISISGRTGWIKSGHLEYRNLSRALGEHFPDNLHEALLDLLRLFDVVYPVNKNELLVSCMLPEEEDVESVRYLVPTAPSGSSDAQPLQIVGRLICLDFIPIGFFSRLMIRVISVPGVTPLYLWKNGLCVTQTTALQTMRIAVISNEQTANLLVLETLTSLEEESSLFNKRKQSDAEDPFTTIVMLVVSFVRGYYPSMESNLTQKVLCPVCMSQLLGLPIPNSATFSTGTQKIFNLGALQHIGQEHLYTFAVAECVSALKVGRGSLRHRGATPEDREHKTRVFNAAPDIAMVNLPLIDPEEITIFPTFSASSNSSREGVEASAICGGFGKVMRGEWHGSMVAIKEPLSGTASSKALEHSVTEFLYEAGIMSSVPAHPNLVTFHGVSLTSTNVWLVMEFVLPVVPLAMRDLLGMESLSKPDLNELVRVCVSWAGTFADPLGAFDRVIPTKLRERILMDVAQGLKHLHTQPTPLIHSDLHAGNIFLSSLSLDGCGPWAKIADFGLSEYLFTGGTKRARHNISVFSPEVLRGDDHNTKSDVWSFGMLCSTLVNPFHTPYDHLLGDPAYCKTRGTSTTTTTTTTTAPATAQAPSSNATDNPNNLQQSSLLPSSSSSSTATTTPTPQSAPTPESASTTTDRGSSATTTTTRTNSSLTLEETLVREGITTGKVSPQPPPSAASFAPWAPAVMLMCWHPTPSARSTISGVVQVIMDPSSATAASAAVGSEQRTSPRRRKPSRDDP